MNVRQLKRSEAESFNPHSKITYVYGTHPDNDMEYIWKVPELKREELGKINIGEKLIVQTKKGPAPMYVTKVAVKSFAPVDKKIRTVIGRPDKE